MRSPGGPRKTGWNTYSSLVLALSATLCGVGLVVVGISWIPFAPVPGVPPNPLRGPYLPGGLTILMGVLAGRQIFLRHRQLRSGPANADDPKASDSGGAPATAPALHAPALGAWRIAGIVAAGAAAMVALLTVVGLTNGYSHRVVDQEARDATTFEVFAGTYSVVDNGGRLCDVGDDYYACIEMHRTMFNSICADRPLNALARDRCDQLSAFVSDAQARYAQCGYGCTTGGEGNWGWTFHTLEADTTTTTIGALPEISHEERCDFDLGFIRFGSCPARDG